MTTNQLASLRALLIECDGLDKEINEARRHLAWAETARNFVIAFHSGGDEGQIRVKIQAENDKALRDLLMNLLKVRLRQLETNFAQKEVGK